MTATRDLILRPYAQVERSVVSGDWTPGGDWTVGKSTGATSSSIDSVLILGVSTVNRLSAVDGAGRSAVKLAATSAYKAADMGHEYEADITFSVDNPVSAATNGLPGFLTSWNGNHDSPTCYSVYLAANGTDVVVSRWNAGTEVVMGTFAHGINLSTGPTLRMKIRQYIGFFASVLSVKIWTGTEPANSWTTYSDATQALSSGKFAAALFAKNTAGATAMSSSFLISSMTLTDLDPLGAASVTPTASLLTSAGDATDQGT